MTPEDQTWERLRARAAAQITPGFADRVLAAARAAAPSFYSQFALSAATAALLFLGVMLFQAQNTRAEENRNLTAWQQIAPANDEAIIGQ
jgi:hypothetical protein